jgi:PIN domain nuclease of toxin-antitoxin system
MAHAEEVAKLPMHHRDPFDRALLAQASKVNLRLVTAGKALGQYAKQVDLMIVD